LSTWTESMLGASHVQMPTLPQLPTLPGSNWLGGQSEKVSMEDATAPCRSLSIVTCLPCHLLRLHRCLSRVYVLSFCDKVWWGCGATAPRRRRKQKSVL
jgi:hypothetical protein